MALTLTAFIDGRSVIFRGRSAWVLIKLIDAGSRGCSYVEQPAPRWGAYIFALRKLGVRVETVWESHSGTFPGRHGRYVLRSEVTIDES